MVVRRGNIVINIVSNDVIERIEVYMASFQCKPVFHDYSIILRDKEITDEFLRNARYCDVESFIRYLIETRNPLLHLRVVA